MKKAILVLLLSFGWQIQYAQEICGFDEYVRKNKSSVSASENRIKSYLISHPAQRNQDSVKIIPVVVHVIHQGGTENISDAQIQSQIDVLNEDFGKIPGTNGDGNGVDTKIQFCLAKKTPDGKCTNGIVRINSSLTNHQTYQRSMLKNLSYWDNSRYLNMYVVKTINGTSGILGYSSFPGGPPDEDGIVVRHNYFGRIGTASSSLGRTTTHEIGHWFGLYHTFNNGCGTDVCSDGDFICDTPPVASPNYGCPSSVNSCSNDNPDMADLIDNYLDYSNDNCKSMFTAGQKNRMHATLDTLRFDIWQQWNIDSTGCDSGYVSPACNVIADFTSNSQTICVTNSVQFINRSLNNPVTYQWWFPGGTPSSSVSENPLVSYNSIGTYDVSLKVTGVSGSDSIFFPSYITVTTPPAGQALPFTETFETLQWPPAAITIDNPDGGITWELDTTAIPYAGIASAKINNLININYGQSDALLLPVFDFTSLGGTPYLSFKWAYAKSDANYSDELIVLVSNDCGVNFSQVFYRTGTAMTTGPTQTTPYIPDSSTVWKTASISLSSYATQTSVLIKIVNVTDGGNNLYIDNINVGNSVLGINESDKDLFLSIYPNPANNEFFISSSEDGTVEKIELVDLSGRTVQSFVINQPAGIIKVSVNNEIPAGIYGVIIKTTNGTRFRKLIIQK
ncbi:MAG: M43 family zinc metalloprotease [Bacteroidota bacterium]